MPAISPNTELSGIIRSVTDHIEAAFKRGVKHGRYLEQQARLPVVHGTWNDCDRFGWSGLNVHKCSECGFVKWGNLSNFCQECGADMRTKGAET